MEYFVSSKNRKVSRLCFGCEALGGTDWGDVDISAISEAIQISVSGGVNFFDTADVYGLGLSEKRLAQVLGIGRHDMFIATKFGVRWDKSKAGVRAEVRIDNDPIYLESAVYSSLKRLSLESIPLGYLHWPALSGDVREAVECLSKLRDKGVLGHVGVSNLSVPQLRSALSVADIDFLQLPHNILDKPLDIEIANLCRQNSISLIVYNALASGLLCDKYDKHTKFATNDRRSRMASFNKDFEANLEKINNLRRLAKEQSLDCRSYAIRQLVSNELISACILGSTNASQINENLDIFSN